MEKVLFLLISITLIFNSCKKEQSTRLPCLCESGQTGVASISISDTEQIILFFPNSFTPNGDMINDYFRISLIHWTYDPIINFAPIVSSIPYNLFIDENQDNLFIAEKQVVFDNPNVGPTEDWSGSGYLNGLYNFRITFNFNGLNYQRHGKVSIINNISNLSNTFNCYPQGLSNCTFSDMIDPEYGFIYPTAEDINNW